jgi:hypothetical protein
MTLAYVFTAIVAKGLRCDRTVSTYLSTTPSAG